MRKFVLVAAALTLPGCTTITALGHTFEGAADYTIVPLDTPALSQPAPAECFRRTCINIGQTNRFDKGQFDQTKSSHLFQEKDNIHISLKTGTIGWFSEGAEQHLLNKFAGLFGDSPVKGEIAIVANVTEGNRSPGSRDSNGQLEGRVVFYSEDIYAGQRLNEFNLPIYGPTQYKGGPLTIDLWLMELDRAESDQMGAVLSTLASMSRAMPAVPIPGVDLLSRIGTSFLKSNQDDVIGHYTITLVQPSRGMATTDPILQVSDVIVRRTHNRAPDLNFNGCTYIVEKGAVVGCDAAKQDSILILSLRKSTSSASIVPQVSLEQLQERLAKAPGPAALQATLDELVNSAVSEGAGQSAIALTDRVKDRKEPQAIREFDAKTLVEQLQCFIVVAKSQDKSVTDALCGTNSKDRQMSREDFDNVARRLIGASCLKPDQLSSAALVPELTDSSIKAARQALVDTMLASCSPAATA